MNIVKKKILDTFNFYFIMESHEDSYIEVIHEAVKKSSELDLDKMNVSLIDIKIYFTMKEYCAKSIEEKNLVLFIREKDYKEYKDLIMKVKGNDMFIILDEVVDLLCPLSIASYIDSVVEGIIESVNIILPYSSGWDSTFILLCLLSSGFRNINLPMIMSINIPASEFQYEHGKKICEILNGCFDTELKIDKVTINIENIPTRLRINSQIPMIALSTCYYLNNGFNMIIRPLIKDDEENITTDSNSFKTMIDHIYPDPHNINIVYPIEDFTKKDVIKSLLTLEKHHWIRVSPDVWFKEFPDEKNSKKLISVVNALFELSNEGVVNAKELYESICQI